MGFAAINDQLACDDCLQFKTEYKDAKDTWSHQSYELNIMYLEVSK